MGVVIYEFGEVGALKDGAAVLVYAIVIDSEARE